MESTSCPSCSRKFSRQDNLRRHLRMIHPNFNGDNPNQSNGSVHPTGSTTHTQAKEPFNFVHPFTMMVTGPTSSGKSSMISKLLLQRKKWIKPEPERILWLYGAWQPLYEKLKEEIPGIEFMEGIPTSLGDDGFLNPNVRNFIIIDDLMSEATKDTRISDLFSRDSHHTNTSTAILLQNLFHGGKEMRNLSLNTNYLTVFKNPRDQQQIGVLARQMYPGNAKYFLDEFKKATRQPFTYMVVDLKPQTSDDKRLRPNILEEPDEGIATQPTAFKKHTTCHKRLDPNIIDQSNEGAEKMGLGSNFRQYKGEDDHKSSINCRGSVAVNTRERTVNYPGSVNINTVEEDPDEMASSAYSTCDECRSMFQDIHDLQKHIRTWCPAQSAYKRPRLMEPFPPGESNHKMFESDESDASEDEMDDDSVFYKLWKRVMPSSERMVHAKRKQYIAAKFSPKSAREHAMLEMIPFNRRQLLKNYEILLSYMLLAKKSKLHRDVLRDITKHILSGTDQETAIRTVLRKRKPQFSIFVEASDEEGSSSEDSNNELDETTSSADEEEKSSDSSVEENDIEEPSKQDSAQESE